MPWKFLKTCWPLTYFYSHMDHSLLFKARFHPLLVQKCDNVTPPLPHIGSTQTFLYFDLYFNGTCMVSIYSWPKNLFRCFLHSRKLGQCPFRLGEPRVSSYQDLVLHLLKRKNCLIYRTILCIHPAQNSHLYTIVVYNSFGVI